MSDLQIRRRPSMADVAALAGVSPQTVSRVSNGEKYVSEPKRQAVLKAMKELGYRPNTAARALVTRRSGLVGIINPSTGKFGPAQMQLAVEMAAREDGFSPSVSPLAGHTSGDMQKAIEHLLAVDVEGIVIIAPIEEMVDDLPSALVNVPVVAVTSVEVARRLGYIAASHDQEAGVRAAIEHLVELGHRDIVHVSGPLDWYEARARLRGPSSPTTSRCRPSSTGTGRPSPGASRRAR